jgi:adenylate cyclase
LLQNDVIRFTQDYTLLQPLAVATIANVVKYSDSRGEMSDVLNHVEFLKNLMLSASLQNEDFSAVLFGNSVGDAITVRNISGVYSVGLCNHTTKNYYFDNYDPSTGVKGAFNANLSQTNYNPRTRPWYVAGAAAKSIVWAPIYINLGNPPTLVLSCAYPFFNQSNPTQFLGVLASQFSLNKISEFLREQKVDGADTFIMERNTILVATSEGLPYSINGSTVSRITAHQHTYYVYGDTVNYITANYGNLTELKEAQFTFVDSKGTTRIVFVSTYKDQYGLNLLVGSILNNDKLLGVVTTGSIIAGVISALAVVVSASIAITFGCCISIPLRHLAKEMLHVANMDLDTRTTPTMKLNEFNEMSNAMTQMKQGLTNFQKFVPAEVVRSLLKSGRGVTLGVKHRNLTILFMDIKDFTTITEAIEPNILINLMSKFFTQMGNAIMESGGTIDKFIGDCIMAMWNAPEKLPGHEVKAIDASFEMRRKLEHLNKKWAKRKYPEVIVRIGINTALTLVGNIGAPERINYTCLGDGVNVAARLEGLNKFFGTNILIGETTYEVVKDVYLCRWVDYLSLKGKNKPIDVYEPLCKVEEATIDQVSLAAMHDDLKTLLHSRDWEHCRQLCRKTLEKSPKNQVVKNLLARIDVPEPTLHHVLHEK